MIFDPSKPAFIEWNMWNVVYVTQAGSTSRFELGTDYTLTDALLGLLKPQGYNPANGCYFTYYTPPTWAVKHG